MDLGTSIIAVVLIALCALPFYLMHRKNILKRKKTLQTVFHIAQKQQLEIGRHDCWLESLIAIDRQDSTLLFSLHSANENAYEIIDLSLVDACELVRTPNHNDGIKSLGLQLFFSGKAPDLYLEFYSDSKNMMPANEFEIARKWQAIIGQALQSKKLKRNSA
ncbi:MAG: hypothetical protein EOO51_08135 [Flavobacterium sp.]|nr:MAG: hypothetical protein EOO51_08135 [Flavobacterium sp.]